MIYGNTDVKGFMVESHKECDELLAELERAVEAKSEARGEIFVKFYDELLRHFSSEEIVLFPALNEFAAKHRLPLRVMEMEHEKMRVLAAKLEGLLDDKDGFFSLSETLMVMLQQHNIKEESQVYSAVNELLGEEGSYVISQLRAVY